MRVFLNDDPYRHRNAGKGWIERGVWPCNWIVCPGAEHAPVVVLYKNEFTLEQPLSTIIHVSADERYELFVDGRRIGRGSERGDRLNWFYESYELDLAAGKHVLLARVWTLGEMAPFAQMSVAAGFILGSDEEHLPLLATGVAPWQARLVDGVEQVWQRDVWGTGANLRVHGRAVPAGWESGEGDGWVTPRELHPGADGEVRNEVGPIHMLRPAVLPPMLERPVHGGRVVHVEALQSENGEEAVTREANLAGEVDQWQRLLEGGSLEVPAGTARRVLVNLGDYFCAYPEVVTSGGAGSRVRVLWAESLFEKPQGHAKGNRAEFYGKHFRGVGDEFLPDGGDRRRFDTLWWQAGMWVQLLVETKEEPLTLQAFNLRATHYPLEVKSTFTSSDERLESIIPIAIRTLEMCSHETFMDCPYYEQLQYVGDTRLEALVTYILGRDDRLARKAIELFDESRINSGLTQSRYPSRVLQIIPTFSLWWIGMVHDYALWRDDREYVSERMRGVRMVVDRFLSFVNADGLAEAPQGWNFVDWVPKWSWGMPAGADTGVSSIVNWQLVLALKMCARLEEYLGELEMAARCRRLASELTSRITSAFWNAERGLYADDLAQREYSEHAQCLAILSGEVGDERQGRLVQGLLHADDLSRTTVYFSHYLFEALASVGEMDRVFERLEFWFGLPGQGFKTVLEHPEPSRSDCHAWGSHPLYHYFATILGIRPSAMGSKSLSIQPRLGPLEKASGTYAHPVGDVTVEVSRVNGRLSARIELPEGLEGVFVDGDRSVSLKPGTQEV